MAAELLCPKCHQPVTSGATFCGNCGTPLAVTAAQPAATHSDGVKGLKPAAWITLVMAGILVGSGLLMMVSPDTARELSTDAAGRDNTTILGAGIILLAIALPPLIVSVLLLTTHKLTRIKKLLIALIVLQVILLLFNLLSVSILIIGSLLVLFFAVRAHLAVKKLLIAPV